MNQFVFVYGTLKEGFPNSLMNKGVRVPGSFITKERYPFYLVGERFSPWLVNIRGQGERITGQVYEVDSAALAVMDRLERITEPDGYRRVELELESSEEQGARTIRAFAYLKQAQHVTPSEVRLGPIAEYTLEHAALYRPRV